MKIEQYGGCVCVTATTVREPPPNDIVKAITKEMKRKKHLFKFFRITNENREKTKILFYH